MPDVTFHFPSEDFKPRAGFAIVVGTNEQGAQLTGYAAFGHILPEHLIGLLTAARDQMRWEHLDIGEKGMLEVLGYRSLQHDEDEEGHNA